MRTDKERLDYIQAHTEIKIKFIEEPNVLLDEDRTDKFWRLENNNFEWIENKDLRQAIDAWMDDDRRDR